MLENIIVIPNIIVSTKVYVKKCISLLNYVLNIKSNKLTSLLVLSVIYPTFTFAAKDNLYNVTTLAGSGKAGYADGTGTAASFHGPNGIAVDAAGNIYVSDRENFVIRKITPSGVVTTFAGTAGKTGNTDGLTTSAKFSSVMINMVHDNADSLYVSDYGNTLIRRISLSTGAVTTFARSVSQIQGITVNNSGEIYYTNPGRNQVMKIPRGGKPITFAGSTKAGYKNGTGTKALFRYPCGITANASNIYVAEYNNHIIRQISTNGTVTTLAGVPGTAGHQDGNKTAAKFRNPVDVQSDKSGNLYVADGGNNVIRKISPSGNVTTIAGISRNAGYVNGAGKNAKFNFPYSLTVDNKGNIYIAEYNNQLIRKIIPNYIGPNTTDTALTNNDYGSFETITFAGGTLKAGTNALTIPNSIVFESNTASTVNAGNTGQYLVFGGNVSGLGGLTISSGTFVLTNANPYTGIITVNPGAMLQFGLGGPIGSIESKSIINNGVVQFGTSGNTSCSAVISGKGAVWKTISGTLTLTGANTYTGSTNIDPSPNKQTNAILIGDISKSIGVTIASTCAYDLNGINRTLIDLSGSGTIQNSGTNADLTLTAQNGSTFTGTIANTISNLIINGKGILTLSNLTPYTGSVAVSSGTLVLTNASSVSGALKLGLNATLAIKTQKTTESTTTANTTTAAGNTTAIATTTTITNPITFGEEAANNNPTITINVNQPTTFTGPLTCNAPAGVTVTLVVTGGHPVTFTGAHTGSFKIVPSGDNTSIITPNYTIGANKSIIYTKPNSISDSLNGYTDVGIDLLSPNDTLIFTNQKAYSGSLSVKKGTLQIGSGDTTTTIPNTNINNNGTINFARASDYTYAGTLNGTGSFRKSASGRFTFTTPATYTGTTTIDAGCTLAGTIANSTSVSISGTYDLNGVSQSLIDPNGTGTIQSSIKNADLTINTKNGSTFSGTLANTINGLTINGTSTFTLSNANPYAGPISVSSGTLMLTNAASLTGIIKLGLNTTLGIKAQNQTGTPTAAITVTSPITFGADATGANPTVNITVNQPTTFSGALTSNAPAGTTITLVVSGGYPVTFTGAQSGSFKFIPSGDNTTIITPKYIINANKSVTYTASNNISDNLSGYTDITLDLPTSTDTLIFTYSKNYTGSLNIKKGTLQIGTGDSSITIPNTNIINNGTINFTQSSDYTFSGILSGTGSFRKSTPSKFTFSNPTSYTGTTTIDQGATIIGDISKSVGVTINGSYDLNGSSRTLIDASGTGSVTSSTKNATLTLNIKNGSTFSGIIANTINGLSVSGKGTLNLTGNNTYTGSTIVNAGATLVGNISNSTDVNIAGTYDLKGTALTLTNLTGTGTIQSTNGTGSTLTVNLPTSGRTTTFSGTLANTVNGFVKTGPGTFILSGTNKMTDNSVTTISAGTLQIGSGSTTGTVISNSIVNNGILSFKRSNDYTYSGVISGTGSVIQNGTGKTLLRGTNTYTGTTTINSGTLNIAYGNNLGSGKITLNGGTLQANANLTLTQPISLTKDSVISTSNHSITLSGNISGNHTLKKNGAGTLTVTGTNTYTKSTIINRGTLQIGSGSTNGSLSCNNVINNGNFVFNRSDTITYPGVISGTGTFTKSGNGIVILTGANTYTGKTVITSGKLQIGSGTLTGSVTSASITNNATLSFNQPNAHTYTGVISGTGSLQQSGSGTLTLAGANTYTGATIIDAGKTLSGNIGSSIGVSISGTYDLNGKDSSLIDPSGTGTIQSSTQNAHLTLTTQKGSTFAGTIANTINKLTIKGAHPLSLSNMNQYTGEIDIDTGGTLLGNISNCARTTVNGTYDLNGTIQTLNNLSGTGKIQSSGTSATLTLTSKEDSKFSGIFDATLNSIVKKGSGTLTLSSSQAYTGEIIISEGTLSLSNTTSTKGIITLSEKTTLQTNMNDESIIPNPINFNSTTMSETPAVIKVNKPTTFTGPLTCNAPPDKSGRLIISGGHTVTLTGKHLGNFAIILSGEGTNVIVKGDANTNTEIVTGSTWFLLNKDKNAP